MTFFSTLKSHISNEGRRLRTIHQRNLTVLRAQPWNELSGAFGDFGTFVPIFVALCQPSFKPLAPNMSSKKGDISLLSTLEPAISPASTLVFSGLANIVTGAFFGLPLPVQPMKAVAAVAISDPLSFDAANVSSAGLFVGGVIGLLSAIGAVRWFVAAVPLPVVRGIQVGAGLSLATKGFLRAIRPMDDLVDPGTAEVMVNAVGTVMALLLLLGCAFRPRLPYVLIIVSVSVLVGITWLLSAELINEASIGLNMRSFLWHPSILVPDGPAFMQGALSLGLGQIPLTALNSIVAVVFLAESLFPPGSSTELSGSYVSNPPTPSATTIGLSVALMNLVGCWFRAMPVCHGSGGLAAQYAFGARSGASVVLLGVLKVVLGLCANDIVLRWSAAFPGPVLGILLVLAGMELVKMGETINGREAVDLWIKVPVDAEREREIASTNDTHTGLEEELLRYTTPSAKISTRRYVVMMATVAASLGLHNAGLGFLVGLALHWTYILQDWESRRLESRQGQIRLDESA